MAPRIQRKSPSAVPGGRHAELTRSITSIEDQSRVSPGFFKITYHASQAIDRTIPVRLCRTGSEPNDFFPAIKILRSKTEMEGSKSGQPRNDINQTRVALRQAPVEPWRFIMLAVGIAVAAPSRLPGKLPNWKVPPRIATAIDGGIR